MSADPSTTAGGRNQTNRRGCRIATLSGFYADNELRRIGDINFYVGSTQYGFVEIAHLALCHAVLDIEMGWLGAA